MNDNGLLVVLGAVGVGVFAIIAGTEAKKKDIPISKQISNMINEGCLSVSGEVAQKYTDEQLKEAYKNVENIKVKNILCNEMMKRRII